MKAARERGPEEAGEEDTHAHARRSLVARFRQFHRRQASLARARSELDRDLKSPGLYSVESRSSVPGSLAVPAYYSRESSRTARSLVHSFTRSPARLGVVTHRRSIPFLLPRPVLRLCLALFHFRPLSVSSPFAASLYLRRVAPSLLRYLRPSFSLTRSFSLLRSLSPSLLPRRSPPLSRRVCTVLFPYRTRDGIVRFTLNMHRVRDTQPIRDDERMPNNRRRSQWDQRTREKNNEPGRTV